MKKALIAAALLGSALIAELLNQNRAPSTPPSTPNHLGIGVQADFVDAESSLIASSWRFVRGEEPLSEGYEFAFSDDGTFVRSVISDYPNTWKGQWNYTQVSSNRGLIFLLGEDKVTDVINYEFLDSGHLRLAGDILVPADKARSYAGELRPKLPNIITAANFPSYFGIINKDWHAAKQIDSGFVPDAYSFHSDGTFLAEYRNQQCSHGGRWSLAAKNLLLEMPSDHCDLRGNQSAFIWSQDFSLIDGTLRLADKYQYEAGPPH